MKRLSNGRFALWICAAFVVPVTAMVVVRFVAAPWLNPFWTDFASMAPVAITTPLFVWLLGRYLTARDREAIEQPDGRDQSRD